MTESPSPLTVLFSRHTKRSGLLASATAIRRTSAPTARKIKILPSRPTPRSIPETPAACWSICKATLSASTPPSSRDQRPETGSGHRIPPASDCLPPQMSVIIGESHHAPGAVVWLLSASEFVLSGRCSRPAIVYLLAARCATLTSSSPPVTTIPKKAELNSASSRVPK
jgi:hypothetical protein